jgi:hypothetical protein
VQGPSSECGSMGSDVGSVHISIIKLPMTKSDEFVCAAITTTATRRATQAKAWQAGGLPLQCRNNHSDGAEGARQDGSRPLQDA